MYPLFKQSKRFSKARMKKLARSSSINHWYSEAQWICEVEGRVEVLRLEELVKWLKAEKVSIVEVEVEEIKELCIHWGTSNLATMLRSEAADLGYPILVTKDRSVVLDGHHRLLKAIREGRETLAAYEIDLEKLPALWKKILER
jgi:hypothetical protein